VTLDLNELRLAGRSSKATTEAVLGALLARGSRHERTCACFYCGVRGEASSAPWLTFRLGPIGREHSGPDELQQRTDRDVQNRRRH
jgi:hypothetical protein